MRRRSRLTKVLWGSVAFVLVVALGVVGLMFLALQQSKADSSAATTGARQPGKVEVVRDVGNELVATPSPQAALEARLTELESQVAKLATRVAALEAPKAVVPTATPTPLAAPKAAAPDYEILSIDSRVTESNDVWWKYAWILEVANHGTNDILFNAEIQFQDADGFVIDTARAYDLYLPAGETDQFSDYILISMPGAANVAKFNASTLVTSLGD